MAKSFDTILFQEDWSTFPNGPLYRDCTARGEYMAMVVPDNINGWYHNARAAGVKTTDRDHSPFIVKKRKAGRVMVMPGRSYAYSVVLTRGEMPWRDYTVTAPVTVKDILPVGLVARYRTNRDFYAAMIESGVFKLVRMLEGAVTVLDSAVLNPGKKPISITLTVSGSSIEASAGKIVLSARDGAIETGGIGLWANGPAEFGKLIVRVSAAESKRIKREQSRTSARVSQKRCSIPGMELIADIDVSGHAIGRQIRFADLDGDGRQEILFGVPTFHKGKKWRYNKLARLSALNLDGDVLWERGKIQDDSIDITADLPFQAADRGNGMEILACFGWSLERLDPMTGKTINKTATPKPPVMEPYWDEINMYWGDGHGDDLPKLIPDNIRLCNFTGRHPYGDFFIKDRYHNVWAYDGETMTVLWHHRANTGHYPFAVDLNGDGIDEVLLGYSRVDSAGKLIGRLYLGDHPDGCFSYVDTFGVRHNIHPCGEAGFIDEYDDWRLAEVHLGHVQHASVANFIPDRPDLERIIVTYHGNEGIIVMMDMDDRILRKVERYGAGSVCQPVNWTGDGRELIGFSPRHGDGGLWDEHFDLVVPFPNDDRPGKYMEVHDMFGLGYDQVIVWDESRLHVYAPAMPPSRRGKSYRPVRPDPNMSNYQVNYSLPRWE